MIKAPHAALLLLLVACGGAETPPADEPSSAPVAPAAEKETVEAPAASAVNGSKSSATAAIPIDDRDDCMGTELDLQQLTIDGSCALEKTASLLPDGIEVSLASSAIEVVEGKEVEVSIVLTNTTETTLALDLDASCGFANTVQSEIFTKGGKSMDPFNRHCAEAARSACVGQVIGVELEAGGNAIIRHPVVARVTAMGEDCGAYEGRNLSPGSYSLKVATAFAKSPLLATLKVSPIERLETKACKDYAHKIADLAEPDPKRRKKVARELFKSCKRQAPTKELANCQLAAATPSELEACQTP